MFQKLKRLLSRPSKFKDETPPEDEEYNYVPAVPLPATITSSTVSVTSSNNITYTRDSNYFPTPFPEEELDYMVEDIGLDEVVAILLEKYGSKTVLDNIPRDMLIKYLKDIT